MNNKSFWMVGGVSVLALLLSLYGLRHRVAPAPAPSQDYGSIVGPDVQSYWFRINGVTNEYRSKALGTATTTPCSLQSPSATSTLVRASLEISVASSTATTWTLAKSTTAYATTTKLSSYSLGSGVRGTMVSTTTDAIGVDVPGVLAPNSYLVWGLAGLGNSYDSSKLTGYCTAQFQVTSR